MIFHLLNNGNKLKLPEVRHPDEVGCTNDPSYCLFYRMIHYPTSRYFVLMDKIQALVNTGVLTLKSEQKSHRQHGDSQFWDFPKGNRSR